VIDQNVFSLWGLKCMQHHNLMFKQLVVLVIRHRKQPLKCKILMDFPVIILVVWSACGICILLCEEVENTICVCFNFCCSSVSFMLNEPSSAHSVFYICCSITGYTCI
jgi:hypothetical protein